jgi:hypothetical protein
MEIQSDSTLWSHVQDASLGAMVGGICYGVITSCLVKPQQRRIASLYGASQSEDVAIQQQDARNYQQMFLGVISATALLTTAFALKMWKGLLENRRPLTPVPVTADDLRAQFEAAQHPSKQKGVLANVRAYLRDAAQAGRLPPSPEQLNLPQVKNSEGILAGMFFGVIAAEAFRIEAVRTMAVAVTASVSAALLVRALIPQTPAIRQYITDTALRWRADYEKLQLKRAQSDQSVVNLTAEINAMRAQNLGITREDFLQLLQDRIPSFKSYTIEQLDAALKQLESKNR